MDWLDFLFHLICVTLFLIITAVYKIAFFITSLAGVIVATYDCSDKRPTVHVGEYTTDKGDSLSQVAGPRGQDWD